MSRTLAACLLLLAGIIPISRAAELLCEAEWLTTDESVIHLAGRGYGFARPALAVGGWVDVQAKKLQQGRFVPDADGVRCRIPAGTLSPGTWQLSLRVVRWTATADQQPVAALRVVAGKTVLEHAFPPGDGALTIAGGIFRGDVHWQWIDLPGTLAVGAGPLELNLAVVGDSGNYLGVLVDAVQFRGDGQTRPVAPVNPAVAATVRLESERDSTVARALARLRPAAVPRSKRLILWPHVPLPGGNPDTRFLREHAHALKRTGVNGLIFSARVDGVYVPDAIFATNRLAGADFEPATDDIRHTDWRGLEDSFLRINVVPGIEWFDDAAWEIALEKVRCLARLVKLANVRGILLDTEEYPPCVFFQYPGGQRSFDEYAAQAVARGRHFAAACQRECPGLTILLTHGVSELVRTQWPPFTPANTRGSLRPAFVDGMLAVRGPTLVDGFESSYTYRTPRELLTGVWQMNRAHEFSRDPARYRQGMRKAFGIWAEAGPPEALEPALHWALRLSDRYVWLYTESLNWFRDVPMPNHQVPSAAYDRALVGCRAPHNPRELPEEKASP